MFLGIDPVPLSRVGNAVSVLAELDAIVDNKPPLTAVDHRYIRPSYGGKAQLTDAMDRDDVGSLAETIIAAALYEEDFELVQAACLQLSGHGDETVRGNAVLGLGHLARLFCELGPEAVEAVRRGLADPSPYVRGQAHAAAGDLAHFLGVEVRSPDAR